MTTILLALLSFALQSAPAAKPPERFAATQPLAELQNKQAVLETDAGTIVIDLLPDAAPNHVAYFLKLAAEGAYNGTTFHRVIKYGIIQGGDPLSKDPAKRPAYGTGGLNVLAAEPGAGKHTAGTVSSVIPRPPCTCRARSMTRCIVLATTYLIMETSSRASLCPMVSIRHAA